MISSTDVHTVNVGVGLSTRIGKTTRKLLLVISFTGFYRHNIFSEGAGAQGRNYLYKSLRLSTMSSSTCTPVSDNRTPCLHDGSSARQRKTRNKVNVTFAEPAVFLGVQSPGFRRFVPREVAVPSPMIEMGRSHTFEQKISRVDHGVGVRMSNEELMRRLKTANDKIRVKSDAFDLIYSQWQNTQHELYVKSKSEATLQARLALLEKRLQDKDAMIEELAFKLSFVEPSVGSTAARDGRCNEENGRPCRPSLARTPRFKRVGSPGSGSGHFPCRFDDDASEWNGRVRSTPLKTPPSGQSTVSNRGGLQRVDASPVKPFALTRSGFFSGLVFKSHRGVGNQDAESDKSTRTEVPANKHKARSKNNRRASLTNSFSFRRSFRGTGKEN